MCRLDILGCFLSGASSGKFADRESDLVAHWTEGHPRTPFCLAERRMKTLSGKGWPMEMAKWPPSQSGGKCLWWKKKVYVEREGTLRGIERRKQIDTSILHSALQSLQSITSWCRFSRCGGKIRSRRYNFSNMFHRWVKNLVTAGPSAFGHTAWAIFVWAACALNIHLWAADIS